MLRRAKDLKMEKQGYVYILTNKVNTVIYVGVTNDLIKRVHQHKQKMVKGFTEKYNTNKLVYYEVLDYLQDALAREKKLKVGFERRKLL